MYILNKYKLCNRQLKVIIFILLYREGKGEGTCPGVCVRRGNCPGGGGECPYTIDPRGMEGCVNLGFIGHSLGLNTVRWSWGQIVNLLWLF